MHVLIYRRALLKICFFGDIDRDRTLQFLEEKILRKYQRTMCQVNIDSGVSGF